MTFPSLMKAPNHQDQLLFYKNIEVTQDFLFLPSSMFHFDFDILSHFLYFVILFLFILSSFFSLLICMIWEIRILNLMKIMSTHFK